MTPYLIWDEDNRAEVRSVEELDLLVDRLTVEARESVPFAVELHVGERTSMFIVVGWKESHMEFYSPAYRPYLWSCRDLWDDDEHVEFFYRGHHSGVPRRYTVPADEAREAMRRFFHTGARPDNVAWGPA